MTPDLMFEFVAELPGIGIALVILLVLMKALHRRDDTIKDICAEHNAAYTANQAVLTENSRVIGECTAVMKDCKDEIRVAHQKL